MESPAAGDEIPLRIESGRILTTGHSFASPFGRRAATNSPKTRLGEILK